MIAGWRRRGLASARRSRKRTRCRRWPGSVASCARARHRRGRRRRRRLRPPAAVVTAQTYVVEVIPVIDESIDARLDDASRPRQRHLAGPDGPRRSSRAASSRVPRTILLNWRRWGFRRRRPGRSTSCRRRWRREPPAPACSPVVSLSRPGRTAVQARGRAADHDRRGRKGTDARRQGLPVLRALVARCQRQRSPPGFDLGRRSTGVDQGARDELGHQAVEHAEASDPPGPHDRRRHGAAAGRADHRPADDDHDHDVHNDDLHEHDLDDDPQDRRRPRRQPRRHRPRRPRRPRPPRHCSSRRRARPRYCRRPSTSRSSSSSRMRATSRSRASGPRDRSWRDLRAGRHPKPSLPTHTARCASVASAQVRRSKSPSHRSPSGPGDAYTLFASVGTGTLPRAPVTTAPTGGVGQTDKVMIKVAAG